MNVDIDEWTLVKQVFRWMLTFVIQNHSQLYIKLILPTINDL